MAYPTYNGVSSYQAWLRTKGAKPAYDAWMAPAAGGGPSGWQMWMRSASTPAGKAAPKGTVKPPAAAGSIASNPAFGVAYNAAKANLADQGMLSSTSAAGTLANATATDRFNNQSLAQKWFELLYSGALGRAGIQQSTKGVVFPNLPTGINSVIEKLFLPPSSSSGPVGDAMMTNQKDAAGGGVTFDLPFYQRERDKVADAQNAERIQIARDQLEQQAAASARAYDLQKAAYDKGSDPWSQMFQAVGSNLQTARNLDPAVNATAFNPTDLINGFKSAYGIDLVEMARNPKDPNSGRALALIKMMYPGGSWTKFFGGDAAQATGDSPWLKTHTPTDATANTGFLGSPAFGLSPVGALAQPVGELTGMAMDPTYRARIAAGGTPDTWWGKQIVPVARTLSGAAPWLRDFFGMR